MPLLKANEPLPQRPVVVGYYGEPGVRKTSIANTAESPLLIDFDRGVARSIMRKDTIIVEDWDEVLKFEKEGFYSKFKTIIIDTAKAALDDFLMVWVVKNDFKLQKNKLQAYGAIGDEFKRFLNARRNEGADVIIIAHAKKDEDTKKMIPDVTGQSYNLILRVADQIGFVSSINNRATIAWNPTDTTVGKNTAGLPVMVIPDKEDPAIKNFMAGIIDRVKTSIVEKSEAEREALEKIAKYQEEIAKAESLDDLSMMLPAITEQPQVVAKQLLHVLSEHAIEIVKKITTADDLNAAMKFFSTPPMSITQASPQYKAIVSVKEKHKMTFDTVNKVFIMPAPPNDDDLKQAIPGESLTDGTPSQEGQAAPQLQFS